ncbi:hypothetical protein MHTCC0001_12620 [Flavobacteriaceae bacterium MHTCC 0001]
MKKRNNNIYIGIPIFIGIILFFIGEFNQDLFKTDKSDLSLKILVDEKLKLFVLDSFSGDIRRVRNRDLKMISEKPDEEIIKNLMLSLNWEKFHVVQLRNSYEDITVSGKNNHFFSTYGNEYIEIIKDSESESVKEMTEILIDFYLGENTWVDEYKSSEEYKHWVEEYNLEMKK